MNLINCYGFSVDSQTMRVYLTEGKVASLSEGVPQGADGVTKGADHGDIVQKLKKVVVNADANLIYVDIAGKPYGGKIVMWEELPHDELGRLIVDSVGKIVRTYKGLGFTEFGGVAMIAADVPNTPTLTDVFPANTSVVIAYDYEGEPEPKFFTGYAFDGTKTYKAEVYDPDEDMAISGLTNGTTYDCWVTATSITGKEGPKSNVKKVKCATVIPAPIFKSCVAGDGFATVTHSDVTPPEPFTILHYAYSAINMDRPEDPAIEGHVVDGKIELPNDITWYVRLCAVCNPGRVPGDFSDALTVTPEKPRVPYKPNITQAYAQNNGQAVVAWTRGVNGNGGRSASGLTVDSWKVSFKSEDGKGKDFVVDVHDSSTTKITSEKLSIGLWSVTVSAHNDLGWSEPSVPAGFAYNPTVEDPFVGGKSFDDGTYKYVICESGATTGYEIIRTKTGETVEAEVLLVGAGGAGKGQALMGAKGGDGGGGQLVITKLPLAYAGSIFVTVPNGGRGKFGDQPADTTVKETSAGTLLTAKAGKSATDKNNAEGFPKQQVTGGWQNLNMFSFLRPGSEYVGGVAVAGEQNYPNATFCGQGGAGTKDSGPGNGQQSYVAIRWKK